MSPPEGDIGKQRLECEPHREEARTAKISFQPQHEVDAHLTVRSVRGADAATCAAALMVRQQN